MSIDIIFYTGIALLITHELDAVGRHEWRIFPVLRELGEAHAYQLFIVLHLPLLILILWLTAHPSESLRTGFQILMDVFFIVHLLLHRMLRKHEKYEFDNLLSRAIVVLPALMGGLHLILLLVD